MAGRRGGRPRAPKQDVFRDALADALADALDVERDLVAVSVTVDGEPVAVGELPLTLELVAPAMDSGTDSGTDEGSDSDEGSGDAQDERPARDAARDDRSDDRDDAPRTRAPRPAASEAPAIDAAELDEEAEAAADLLEGLLDAMDLPGDLRISLQEAHAEVEVVGLEEGVLIGRRGQTLDAIQELVRTAMQRRFERRSRVLVDVDGYRARRLEKLLERADEAVEEVLETGEPQRLEPMDAIERRLVHQRVAETAGVTSTSHGREPARRIVIELADD